MVSWYRTLLEGSHGEEPEMTRLEDALNAEASQLAPGSNGLLEDQQLSLPGPTLRRYADRPIEAFFD